MKKKAQHITVEQALSLVKSGDYIVLGMLASEPKEFVSHLHTVVNRGVTNLTVSNCLPIENAEYFTNPKYKDHFQNEGWFFAPNQRKSFSQGNISFIPNHLHFAATKRFQHRKPTIFVGVCTPPDRHGFVSLSTGNVIERQAIDMADMVILEENPNFPNVYGDVELHISKIDYLVKTDYPVPTIPDASIGDKDQIIGKYIADLIPDGATIQLGIGSMPDAVAASLGHKKNLGLHTEMFTTGAMKLIKAGVINGSKKTLHKDKHVACFAFGTQELYDFINSNPSIMMLSGRYVNDPAVIGKNYKQVSINAALEVDFAGQCASESIGTRQWSGTGGQTDTAVGALNSEGGMSFIALYSTAMVTDPATGLKVEKSKIVPTLMPGAIVSLMRQDTDHVVTEYGVVCLRGTSMRERTLLLISIAHPKFRDELKLEAKKLGFIKEND